MFPSNFRKEGTRLALDKLAGVSIVSSNSYEVAGECSTLSAELMVER